MNMEAEKVQIVESEGLIARVEENGLTVGDAVVDHTLHLTHESHDGNHHLHHAHHHAMSQEHHDTVLKGELPHPDNDPTVAHNLASSSALLAQRIVSQKTLPTSKHHTIPKLETVSPSSNPLQTLPVLQATPTAQSMSQPQAPQSTTVPHPSQLPPQQQQPAQTQAQVQQPQQPQQTPDGKAVKRGRGGRRIGAGRKRKVDSISKGDGSPTASPSQPKTHPTAQTPSSSRHPLHGNIATTETNTPSSKPAKKKKLYDELSDGVKNSSRQLKFGYTILYVKEVEKTVEFYERAFGLKRRFVHESKQYAEMDTGVTALSFASNELAKSNLTPVEFRPNEPNQLPPGMEIAFSSFDVQRDYKRAVDAGAKSVSAPKVLPWGQIVAYVRDLNGVLVEIASTSAAANK